MATRLHLIRHSQTVWNAEQRFQGHADSPLSETGLAQAKHLADRFRDGNAVALYSSPQQRAYKTAETIAATTDLSIHTDERLKERDVGLLTGLTWSEITKRYPEFARRWSVEQSMSMPEGEADDVFRTRAKAVMSDIVTRHNDADVIVVSHGGLISIYLLQLLRIDPGLGRPFHFDNASVTLVEVNEGRPHLHRLNDISHLVSNMDSTSP